VVVLAAAIQVGMAMAAVGMVLLRTAAFVDALGVVGAGLGFMAGGISTGTMEGALTGAEVGFKIGTGIQLAIDIGFASYELAPLIGEAGKYVATTLGANGLVGSIVKFATEFILSGIAGEVFTAIGRNAGGVLNPDHEGFEYDRRSAEYGKQGGSILGSVGGITSDIEAFNGATLIDTDITIFESRFIDLAIPIIFKANIGEATQLLFLKIESILMGLISLSNQILNGIKIQSINQRNGSIKSI
jgi:hypothetical protein